MRFVFASVLSEKFNERSDIDMVVRFDTMDLMEYADNYFDLKEQLEVVLKRPIDLLEEQAIRNTLLKMRINESKQLIYGKGN
ncbi:hypothetical protein BN938_2233 [Mucinivorans hirudinis]|uniref:Polymerase beta nucleotidyltransferase domain-containing protein n=1 Tax=Mucinivorans hirudinis TaxID=1433126 RepID=A0A060R9L2_9BACT|nr:hypothetical protein BN938_2233 [Mucinivorans hirudinis]